MSDLSNIAINAALTNDWNKAITTNLEIIKNNSDDINALNRLAFAFIQTNRTDEAKKIYKKILAIDKYNLIALKNLEKISSLRPKKIKSKSKNPLPAISPSLFIEEPGRTKTVTLINPAHSEVLSSENIGDPIAMHPKKHSIEIRDNNNIYLGALPDDIAFRLIRLLKSGNQYRVNIKNIAKNNITVFLAEIKRGKRFANQPSFLTSFSQRNSLAPMRSKSSTDDTSDEEEIKPSQEDDVE